MRRVRINIFFFSCTIIHLQPWYWVVLHSAQRDAVSRHNDAVAIVWSAGDARTDKYTSSNATHDCKGDIFSTRRFALGRTCTLTGYVMSKIRTLSRALQSSRVLGSKFMICLGLGNMYSRHVWYLPWIHTWHFNIYGIYPILQSTDVNREST